MSRQNRAPVRRVALLGRPTVGLLLVLAAWTPGAGATPLPRGIGESEPARSSEPSRYRRGLDLLDQERWEEAAETFALLARGDSSRAESARYWTAYALYMAGRGEEASTVLGELLQRFPNGLWADDARSLQAEIALAATSPADAGPEDPDAALLRALSSLVFTNPERVTERLIAYVEAGPTREHTERAFAILVLCDTPRSRAVVMRYARGEEGPELRRQAVRVLGSHGEVDALLELFEAARTLEPMRDLLHAFSATRQPTPFARVAGDRRQPMSIRREAAQILANHRGMNAATQESAIDSLYVAAPEAEIRAILIKGLAARRQDLALIRIARRETDSTLRRQALTGLLEIGTPEASEYLKTIASGGTP